MTWSAGVGFWMYCSLFGIVDDVPQSCTNQMDVTKACVIVLAAGKESDGPRCFVLFCFFSSF